MGKLSPKTEVQSQRPRLPKTIVSKTLPQRWFLCLKSRLMALALALVLVLVPVPVLVLVLVLDPVQVRRVGRGLQRLQEEGWELSRRLHLTSDHPPVVRLTP